MAAVAYAFTVPLAWPALVVLAVLYVVTESQAYSAGPSMVMLAVNVPVTLASYMIIGPWGAAVVGATSVLAVRSIPHVARLFNGAQFALSALVAGHTYVALGGPVGHFTAADFPRVLFPVVAANVVHCLVNGLLVVVIVTMEDRISARAVIRGTLAKSVLPYLGYGLFGLLMAVLWTSGIGPFSAVLVLLPLLVARWAFKQYAEQQAAYEATIRTLVQAVETKDHYTRGHSERVSRASVMIARVIGMREDRVVALRYAGILHDVGKLGVPTKLLQKSGPLTEGEFAAIQLHPVRGREMVHEIEFLDEALQGIFHHHERIDGRGYPEGLSGQAIPEFARVIAVADAFDSMTSTRSYRGARTVEEAVVELERCKGSQFDPALVEALIAAVAAEGWEPAQMPDSAELADAVASFDHDDPTMQVPVRQAGSVR